MRTRALMLALLLLPAGCIADGMDDEVDDVEDVAESEEALSEAAKYAARFEKVDEGSLSTAERNAILSRWSFVRRQGVRRELYESAVLFFDANRTKINNTRWLGIVDFGKHSRERRFVVLDMRNGTAPRSFVVAHGSGSDPNNDGVATAFSNISGSNMSSIGFYETAELYNGKHGHSMRLNGLSTSNLNVRRRAIVIHGASYVDDGRAKQGRSQGCLAVPYEDRPWILDNLRDTIIYAAK